jgi:CBS domain containing-hemolysin-like protein
VPGNFPLREVNRRLDLDLRESPYWTTLGGLYLGQAGRIPSSGESLALGGGVSADILEVKGARLVAVRLHKPAVQDEQGASPA